MRKVIFIVIVVLGLGCSEKKKDNPKFSDKQMEQLGLRKVKPLQIFEGNCLTLDLNNFLQPIKNLSVGNLIYDVKYIPLQTTEESLIAEINKLIYSENHFFILDLDIGHAVFIFSDDGKFIKKIPVGQGPGEIYNPGDIAIDEENNNLVIYNRKGLSYYDYDGNFIKRELAPFNFKNFRIIPDGFLFISVQNQNEHLSEFSEMQVFITDENFRIISTGLPFHYSKSLTLGITDYTNSFKDQVEFSLKFSDKIYQYIDTSTVREKYQLDFSKKRLPSEHLMNTENIINVLKQNDYYYFMGNFVENETHEYFSLYNNFNKKAFQTFIFRDKSTGKFTGGNIILLENESIPLFATPLTADENEFIGSVTTSSIAQYLSERKELGINNTVLDKLNPDDNPVLIKYKLKNIH